MTPPLRLTALLATISGGALVVDCVTVAALNRAFDPLDSILFFIGFVGMLLTALALGVALSTDARGWARVGRTVLVFLGSAVVLGVVSTVVDRIGRHVFSPDNIGLHGEWSFFSIGVCLLLLALWAGRRSSQAESTSTSHETPVA